MKRLPPPSARSRLTRTSVRSVGAGRVLLSKITRPEIEIAGWSLSVSAGMPAAGTSMSSEAHCVARSYVGASGADFR